ncbi:MAG: hypothetical protein ABMB14_35765, partial [Myxococcota bacterium]
MRSTILVVAALWTMAGCDDSSSLAGAAAGQSRHGVHDLNDDNGGGVEPGDDNGGGVEPGDDNGGGVEPGDDNGGGVEPGDDN